ncbi:fibrillin-3 isoform X6 [Biomphalaria glabrata]|nr:fibrillin-3 isoform X6 [Biomphalaria glabrata]
MKGTKEASRPHWVDTVDKEMTHSSKTSDWNQGFDDDLKILANGKKKRNGRQNILTRRLHKKSKPEQAESTNNYRAMLYRGHYSDTSSLASRLTSSSSERRSRKRSRKIALFLLLLLLAFVIAALFGWLIYYLLSKAPSGDKVLAADVSLRILNETHTASLANKTSKEFLQMEKTLCREIDHFFTASTLRKSYSGCEINAISNVGKEPGCQCVWSNDGTLLVNLKLRFNDSQQEEKLALSVYNTIDVGATKHYIDSLTYVVIKDFLVDIRVNGKYAYDGIDVEMRLPVFNLNYTKQLEDTSSRQFQTLADPFCLDKKSKLAANDFGKTQRKDPKKRPKEKNPKKRPKEKTQRNEPKEKTQRKEPKEKTQRKDPKK